MIARSRPDVRLLEREAELKTLASALESAHGGTGRLVTITGEPGIGKSTLLAAAGSLAADRGLSTLRARGTPLEGDIPFGVALQLLSLPVSSLGEQARSRTLEGAAGLARPLLEGSPSTPEPSLLHGLFWLAANLSEARPLALLVDDAHWADSPSLTWLNYLAHRIEDLPLVLVVGFRRCEPNVDPLLLDALANQPAASRLEPAALSASAVERAVRERHPDAPREFCATCLRVTEGNPFFLRELLEAAAGEGFDTNPEELAALAPRAVTRSVLERLRRVDEEAVALARAVAVLGDGAPLPRVSSLAKLDGDSAGRIVDELTRVDILRFEDGVAFRHPLLRSAVYADIPAAASSALHSRAANLLRDSSAPADRLAAHLLRSTPKGCAWVVDALLESAARARAGGAQSTAVAFLRRALAEPPEPPALELVLVDLAFAEAAAGEKHAPDRFGEALAMVADKRERARLSTALAHTLSAQGRGIEAAAAIDRMLEELDDCDRNLALALQATWIGISRTSVSLRERAPARVQAMLQAESEQPSREERLALAQLASERLFAGEPREETVRLARLAYGEGRLLELETADGSGWVVALSALGWCDDLGGFERGFLAGLEDARQRGSVHAFATCSYALSFSRYHRGCLAEAAADARQALEAERYGWREYAAACRAQLAWSLIARDELDQASEAIAPLERDPAWQEHPAYALVVEARGRIALARDDRDTALAALLEAGRRIEAAQISNPTVLAWRSSAAIAASTSDRDLALELVAEELAAARHFGAPRAIGTALRAEGVVRGGEDGIELLRQAVAELDHSPAALERTRALVDLGAALRGAGHSDDARAPLREALDQSHRMGAFALERRAREELVATGARPRRAAMTGVAALTPSERRVATMAAQGMSNREIAEALFVTVKAVQWHLTHIYRKLAIRHRSDLPPPRDFG